MKAVICAVWLGLIFVATSPAGQPGNPCDGPPVIERDDDLLVAIKMGTVEAKVIARDVHHVRVFLRNPSVVPISVNIPEVVAARPVLAQANNNFFFGQPQNNNTNNSGNQGQTIGGPMQFNNNNNGIFAIPPESVREVRIKSVCLEHGKPDPESRMTYELVGLSDVGGSEELGALLARYGKQDLDRDTVQAAAWHLANGKSWQELAAMSKFATLSSRTPIFSARQLHTAKQLVIDMRKLVAERKKKVEETIAADTQPVRMIEARESAVKHP